VPGAREIGRAPEPIPASNEAAFVVLVALELVAIWTVVRIWREKGRPRLARLAWTVITLVPVFGLIAYAVWCDPPPPNGPTDRPSGRSWDTEG
jgi:hypothetical protein